MGVFIGPFDPLQLVFNTINLLLRKGIISYEEAREILKNSLDKTLSEEKKEEILNSLIRRT
jgi:hypothetical protein